MSASSQNVIIGTGFMYQPEIKFQKANNKKTNKIYKERFSDAGPQAAQKDYPGERKQEVALRLP